MGQSKEQMLNNYQAECYLCNREVDLEEAFEYAVANGPDDFDMMPICPECNEKGGF